MRVRNLAVIVGVFGAAAAAAAFVVSQLPPGGLRPRPSPGTAALAPARAPAPAASPAGDAAPAGPRGAIEGIALLGDGRPAAGATVRAASRGGGATAVAGQDGRFRIAVAPGSHAVLAVLGERAGALAAPVPVAAGATTRAPAITLDAAAAIAGTVATAAGPARGAQVVLLAHETAEVIARAEAGADGRFLLAPLAPAAYDVAAAAPGAAPALLEGVTLAPGQRFAARLALPPPGAVTGTVRDEAGRGLAGIRVRAAARAPGLRALAPAEARTDFDGRFRLAPLAAGGVEVIAREEALQVGVAREVSVSAGRDTAVELVLPGAGVLSGSVSGGERPPPPGTTIVAVPLRRGEGGSQAARATADARGGFELPLPAGEYRVHAAAPAGAPAPRGGGAAAAVDQRVAPVFARVAAERTTRVALALAPAAARGAEILVLEPGGAPSPGAAVTLSRPDDARVALAAEAGADGRVPIDARMGLSGRRVTIRARSGGRAGATTLELPEAGTVPVHLAAAGAVAGVVRGARDGFTLEVSTLPAAGGWRAAEVHRYAGERFALGDLPAEPLRLVARSADGRRGTADVRVEPGETRTVELTLR